jgi:catechol 2,3-dioxygenase-like lactoylglutathione lyase family enzyme
MQKYKFDHIHLMSPNPEKTAEFYQKMFNARMQEPVDLGQGRIMLSLDLGGVTVLISKTADEKQYGLAHFGISTPHLKEAVAELKAKNVKFPMEITKISPQLTISFVDAPDNVRLELSESEN